MKESWVVVVVVLLGCAGKADGEATAAVTCGGTLTGQWVGDGAPPASTVKLNACSNLVVESSGGSFSARTYYPRPKQRSFWMRFNADGNYTVAMVDHGPVTLRYAAACLVTTQGSPTCTQLGEALLISGLGEGSVQQVSCVDGSAGGCDCTLQVNEVGGPVGSFVAEAATGDLHLTRNQTEMLDTSYCVKETSLRFGPKIDGFFGGASRVTFSSVSCDDGVQGPGESGVDCGLGCPTQCP